MSAELSLDFPVTTSKAAKQSAKSLSTRALHVSARIWFIAAVAGQLIFAFTVAAFYGLTAARGDWWAWNRNMMHGYAAGRPMGNFAVAMHLISAVVIILAGALQFIPSVRMRLPRVHRWVGRLYMLTAFMLSFAGLYMHFVNGAIGDAAQRWGSTIGAAVIWLCAVMALRYAIKRDFATHRRWAMRLYLSVMAAWFFRVGFFFTFIVFQGPVGFDPSTFTGPLLTFMSYGQYLVPLAILELYFLAQERGGAIVRGAMAAFLAVVTLAMLAGTFGVSAMNWFPSLRAAFDSRKSIAHALDPTIQSQGVDAAIRQYHALKASQATVYNFGEGQLNTLGYQLLRAHQTREAIRIFELNVEAYPRLSNPYDSLAEAYLSAGDKTRAIALYKKAVAINPKNANAAAVLRRLGAS